MGSDHEQESVHSEYIQSIVSLDVHATVQRATRNSGEIRALFRQKMDQQYQLHMGFLHTGVCRATHYPSRDLDRDCIQTEQQQYVSHWPTEQYPAQYNAYGFHGYTFRSLSVSTVRMEMATDDHGWNG